MGHWVGSAHSLYETVSAPRSLISLGEIQHTFVFSALTVPFLYFHCHVRSSHLTLWTSATVRSSLLLHVTQRRLALIYSAVEAWNHASVKVILSSGVKYETGDSRATCSSSHHFGDPRNFSKQACEYGSKIMIYKRRWSLIGYQTVQRHYASHFIVLCQ
jgi:hypothetical protein